MTMQPCWTCTKYAGDCLWSRKFEPIPGWDAVPAVKAGGAHAGHSRPIHTYDIRYCPEYEDDGTGGVPMRSGDWEEVRRIILYRAGLTDREMAEAMRVGPEAIRSWRKRRGLKRNRRGKDGK